VLVAAVDHIEEQGAVALLAVCGPQRRRRMEIFAFLFLTAVLMPALAVATVGSYGLAVWVYQMMAGPPGPPRAEPKPIRETPIVADLICRASIAAR
jgi:nitrate reductase NapE